jgi:amino acid transporter
LGAAVVIIFSVIALFGVRLYGLLLQLLFIIPAVLTVAVFALLASADAGALSNGMQRLWNTDPDTFTSWVATEGQMTQNLAPAYWAAVGTAAIGAYWAYIGYAGASFVAGEVKESNRNLPLALLIGGAVIVLVYVASSSLLYRATSLVGGMTTAEGEFSFFSAWAYASYGGNIDCPATGAEATARACFNRTFGAEVPSAWMPLAAALQADGAGLAVFIPALGVFAILWVMNDIPPFILTASRALFAMSFDRTLPARFSDVSERWHSPTWAIMITMIIGVIGAMFEAESSYQRIGTYNASLGAIFGGGVAATSIWDATFFILFSLAAGLLPILRKDIWQTAPYKPRIGPIPLISITGFAAFIGNIVMYWAMLSSPAGYGLPSSLLTFDSAAPVILTIVLLLVFTALYVAYTSMGRTKGADFRTIYTEIPPE